MESYLCYLIQQIMSLFPSVVPLLPLINRFPQILRSNIPKLSLFFHVFFFTPNSSKLEPKSLVYIQLLYILRRQQRRVPKTFLSFFSFPKMGTAYASFTSLMNIITDLHEHPHPPIKLDEEHVDSLNSNFSFFRGFLKDHHKTVDGGVEIRMADAAHAVEDLIETHISDRVLDDFYGSLQRGIDGLDLIRKEVMEMNLNEQSQPKCHPAPSQSPSATFGEDTVVGLEDFTSKIVAKVTAEVIFHGGKTVPITIVGMAGIGKTTLARRVYSHPLIKEHFDVVAWAGIPMDSTTEHILTQLLLSLHEAKNMESLLEGSEHKLGEKLYDCLVGKKYLVVLDNVYDPEVWESLRRFFPDGRYSQIVITTRELRVASSMIWYMFQMDLLDEHRSWELFCKKVFGKDSCPSQLEDVGKKIARNCAGLPLSISVIGEHLAMSQRTQKYWEHVANNISSLVFSLQKEESLKELSISYTRLPVHLKPCFLYMGIFPEDEEIEVYKLTRLWVAEGFINPTSWRGLESTAGRYLTDLVERSLILPSKYSRRGRLKTCKIHGLLRHLCIKEALEKKFFYLALKIEDLRAVENERRIVRRDVESEGGHSLPYYNVSRSRSLRTFIFEGELSWLNDKKLLRVLAPVIGSSSFLLETLADIDQLVNIRYLDPSIPFFLQDISLPSSIGLLWNLQYLVFDIKLDRELPHEIWKMARLRDVKMQGLFLPHPPSESNDDVIIMKNLHSAQTLLNFNFSREVVERIPNIEKLKVRYDYRAVASDEFLDGIDRLEKLQSLGCFFDLSSSSSSSSVRIRNVSFPESLWKLNISHLRWEDVTDTLGSLPNLRVLKLRHCEGSEWELVEGRFSELGFLHLSHCPSLRNFKAHVPGLLWLVLERLDHLQGFNLRDYTSLDNIQVDRCPDSAVISAIENANSISRVRIGPVDVKVRLLEESALSESLISTDDERVRVRVRLIK